MITHLKSSIWQNLNLLSVASTILLLSPNAFGQPTYNQPDNLMIANDPTKDNRSVGSTLEIVGYGVTVETWRNHPDYPDANLWRAVENSNGDYIVSQDKKNYPTSYDEWKMVASKRNSDSIDAAQRDFMDRYPLPIAVVGPSWGESRNSVEREDSREANARSVIRTTYNKPYTAVGGFGGLLTQRGQIINSYLNDNPDLLWQTVFATVDLHEDIPAIGLAAKDGAMHRALTVSPQGTAEHEKLAADQVYRPKNARIISDSYTFITLVKRGRIDDLRPLAQYANDNMQVTRFRNGELGRNYSEFRGWKSTPPKAFKATPYIAQPWTSFQIDQYDHLENHGTLYRPQVVSFLNDDGKPITDLTRATRIEAALRAALAPLGGKLPKRIFYDYGSVWDDRTSSTRFVPFVQAVSAIDESFDLLNPRQGYDLARILGDTGAGSPFVAVALASMAGRQSGGATLIANLRRNDGASFILVVPPSAEQIKKDAAIKRPYFPTTKNIKDVE